MRISSAIFICFFLLAACQRDKHLIRTAANGVTIAESPYHWHIEPFDYEVGSVLPVYYMGPSTHNINMLDFPLPAWQRYSLDTLYEGNYPIHKAGQIELFVDTSIITYFSHAEHRRIADTGEYEQIMVSNKAYPVFMHNNSDSLFFVGEGNRIEYTVIEALDSTSNWVQVAGGHSGGCGTSARQLMLKPNGMLIAKYPIRSGDTYTRLRLKISRWKDWPVIYSNEFWGRTTFPPPAAQ